MRPDSAPGIVRLWRRLVGRTSSRPSESQPSLRVAAFLASQDDRETLRNVASDEGWRLTVSANLDPASVGPLERDAAVVIVDRVIVEDWRTSLAQLQQSHSGCIFLASHVIDDYLWHEVRRLGGYDILVTPLRQNDIRSKIEAAWLFWRASTARHAASA